MSNEGLYRSDLDDLQKAIVDHLQRCSALRGIEVYSIEVGDVEDAIATQLAQIGATIFVSEVELGGVSGDLANVSADDAQFTVQIFVQPTTNSTGRNAAALREYVMRRLHHWTPGVQGAGIVTLMPDPEDGRPNYKQKQNVRLLTFRLSQTLEAGID